MTYKMFYLNLFILFILCAINEVKPIDIPDYIKICKRDPDTISDCVRSSIEMLRPHLAEGIPELNVPGIEPFYVSEVIVDSGELIRIHAAGKDVKVSGAGNFSIKYLNVDLDSLIIRGRVRFPKLHFEGRYKMNSQVLVIPLQGQGNIAADAVKCDAEITMRADMVDHSGVEYLQFVSMDLDLGVKDYRLKIDGLFNGDHALGDAANQAINQNRVEFFKASKPYVVKTVSNILLDTANKIAGSYPLDALLPKAQD